MTSAASEATVRDSENAALAAGSQFEGLQLPPFTNVSWPPTLTLLIVFLLCFLRMWGRVCCLSDEVSHAAFSSPDPEQDGCGAREQD